MHQLERIMMLEFIRAAARTAVGVRMMRLPMTKERVRAAMKRA